MKSFFKTALFLILTGAFLPMAIYADNPTPTPQAPASQTQYVIPKLGIEIPGVVFTTPTEAGTDIRVPFLMEYVNGVYRFAITLGMLASIIVIMWGGFLYLAGSTIGSVEKGKKKIVDAIAGFAILLGATAILNTVSPLSARVQMLSIPQVEPEPLETYFSADTDPNATPEQARAQIGGSASPNSSARSIPAPADVSQFRGVDLPCLHIGGTGVRPELIPMLQAVNTAFCELRGTHTNWRITGGGYRSIQVQAQKWYDNCYKNGKHGRCGLPICNPLKSTAYSGSAAQGTLTLSIPETVNDIVANSSLTACAHPSGIAVDISCIPGEETHIDTPCHLALEEAMRRGGFCRLITEPWHFEANNIRVSRFSCTTDWQAGTQITGDHVYNYAQTCPQGMWNGQSKTCQPH